MADGWMSFFRYDVVTAFVARAALSFFEFGSMKSYGVIVQELTRQANLSFTTTGLILPLQRTLTYIAGPFSSILLNRVGARTMMMVGGFLVGLGYIGNGVFPWTPILLILCFTVIGSGFGAAWVPSFVHLRGVLKDDKQFSIAQTLTDQFSFIGMAVLPVVFDRFREGYGVRGALMLFGALMFHLIVTSSLVGPSSSRLVRQSRDVSDMTIRGYCDRVTNNEVRCLLVLSVLVYYITIGWALFSVTLGEEKGLLSSEAVLLSSVAGIGAIFGRIWCIGLFYLEVSSPFHFFGIPSLIQCMSLIGLVKIGDTLAILLGFSFVVGITMGVTGAAICGMCSYIASNEEEFKQTLVMIFLGLAVGTELGGGLSGAVYDYYESSEEVFLVMAFASSVMMTMSFFWSVSGCARNKNESRSL